MTDPPHESTAVTVVTGLEGPVEPTVPVRCLYCDRGTVTDDDHATDCFWKRGEAPPR
ncbi:hypothetical protein [Streptomyces millisiae]|uniref:Uncharacterized protein n=1 Tax=Streptomyces millisiae TaxID=3075542 RepID=A0ABU2LYX9_9ACTN|nr:hypothetical protein [Streptomyces sp. DSM 44918]MDT0322228.1 hypothetical protein [Streptomyces sp. DSM 44918]